MKSLIVSAALAVSTLFAGTALADQPSREAERPSVKSAMNGRGMDPAARTAMKMRERNEHNGRASTAGKLLEAKLDKFRPRGDMVEDKGKITRVDPARQTEKSAKSENKMLKNKVDKRGDVERTNPNQRRFTVANDRKNRSEHSGPLTIVDIMKRREALKFLSAAGIKINCSQTGTCVEETTM